MKIKNQCYEFNIENKKRGLLHHVFTGHVAAGHVRISYHNKLICWRIHGCCAVSKRKKENADEKQWNYDLSDFVCSEKIIDTRVCVSLVLNRDLGLKKKKKWIVVLMHRTLAQILSPFLFLVFFIININNFRSKSSSSVLSVFLFLFLLLLFSFSIFKQISIRAVINLFSRVLIHIIFSPYTEYRYTFIVKMKMKKKGTKTMTPNLFIHSFIPSFFSLAWRQINEQ